jgi:hypothetical protein
METKELVAWLRGTYKAGQVVGRDDTQLAEAADLIEKQAARIVELEAAQQERCVDFLRQRQQIVALEAKLEAATGDKAWASARDPR